MYIFRIKVRVCYIDDLAREGDSDACSDAINRRNTIPALLIEFEADEVKCAKSHLLAQMPKLRRTHQSPDRIAIVLLIDSSYRSLPAFYFRGIMRFGVPSKQGDRNDG